MDGISQIFCSTPKGSLSSTPFRLCRYLHRFQRYLRSNLNVIVNRTDFWTFFALPNFKGGGAPKVPKFRRATLPNSEVISANLLHFKPIFDPPLKNVVRGAAVPCGKCASKTRSFSSACKNLGAQHPLGAKIKSSEQCAIGGYHSTSRSPRLLDQTSSDLFRLMR